MSRDFLTTSAVLPQQDAAAQVVQHLRDHGRIAGVSGADLGLKLGIRLDDQLRAALERHSKVVHIPGVSGPVE